MNRNKTIILAVAAILLTSRFAPAEVLSPSPGYSVAKSETTIGGQHFITMDGTVFVGGKRSFYLYRTEGNKIDQTAVIEHYISALEHAGGTLIWKESPSLGGRRLSGRIIKNGYETWFHLELLSLREYMITEVTRAVNIHETVELKGEETELIKTEAEALKLLYIVDNTGELTLDVKFKLGQASPVRITPMFAQIAAMMRKDLSYSFRVEVPVDSPKTGSPEQVRTLLRNRRVELTNALIKAGVPASRITSEYPVSMGTPPELKQARLVLLNRIEETK